MIGCQSLALEQLTQVRGDSSTSGYATQDHFFATV